MNSESIRYISLTEAANRCEYSQEYLSLRARQGKLKAVKQGRNWVTTHEWLIDYLRHVDDVKQDLKESTTIVSPAVAAVATEIATPTLSVVPSVIPQVLSDISVSTPVPDDVARPAMKQEAASVTSPVHSDFAQAEFVAALTKKEDVPIHTSVASHWFEDAPVVQRSHRDLFEDSTDLPVPEERFDSASWEKEFDAIVEKNRTQTVKTKNPLTFNWLQPVAIGALALLLMVEIGLLVRPVLADPNASVALNETKSRVAVGASVFAGDPPPLTWEQGSDEPRVATDEDLTADTDESTDVYGVVAGAQSDRTADEFTTVQKMAAGVLMIVDSPKNGVDTAFGQWLADQFNLPQ